MYQPSENWVIGDMCHADQAAQLLSFSSLCSPRCDTDTDLRFACIPWYKLMWQVLCPGAQKNKHLGTLQLANRPRLVV